MQVGAHMPVGVDGAPPEDRGTCGTESKGDEWSMERLRCYLLWVKANFRPKMGPEAKDVGSRMESGQQRMVIVVAEERCRGARNMR
jgi:hypothetical protein